MPIIDHFDSFAPQISGPVTGGTDLVPDDSADLTVLPRALMVTGAGDVAVVFKDDSSLVLPNLLPGVIYPLRVKRVLDTGTTATGIKGLF